MDTLNYSDGDGIEDRLQVPLSEGSSCDVSEYIGALIRAGEKEKARAVLEAEILKGINSPHAPMTEQDWAEIRAEVLRRHEARRAQKRNSSR